MQTITIIYSSGGGNTKLVIDKVSEILIEHDIQVEKINAITATPDDMKKTNITILAAPTYDHGVLHAPFERFIFVCKKEKIQVKEYRYAVIGLGDNKYDDEYNMESAPILESFVTEHGGTLLCDSLKINKSPVDRLDTIVKERTETFVKHITKDI